MIRSVIMLLAALGSAALVLPLLALGQTKDSEQPDASAPSATGFENGRLKAAATEPTGASHSGADQMEGAQKFRGFLDADWTITGPTTRPPALRAAKSIWLTALPR